MSLNNRTNTVACQLAFKDLLQASPCLAQN